MGSLSRFFPDTSDASEGAHDHNHLIYAIFCFKDASCNISNVIDCYDPSHNSWHRVTSIPGTSSPGDNLVLKNFAMVSIGHHIYIIGGRLCRKVVGSNDTDICIVEEKNLMVLDCVRRYDTRTDSWETCQPMNSPRFDFACTVCGDQIFVAGGQETLDQARGISSAEMYDTSSDEWRFLANMSTKRYKCVGATWQGKIHVLGGFAEKGDGGDNIISGPFNTTRSSGEVYDPEHDSWEFLARMWDLDIPPYQIVAINGKLFSSGDCLIPWKGHVETYSETEKMWNVVHGSHYDNLSRNFTRDDHVAPMRRMYLTMAPIGNRLYFLTGYKVPGGESRLRNEVHVFDTAASDRSGWRSFEPVMEEREKELCGHCCVLVKHVS
ncbi:F-box/kelch-repeat protein At1g16250-like [Henckelia pumila]|uniref:F-box/kelch-repeat protein At1g16250-like n=1 Tax=Henckelia pumila TaxID=405737 RepID=UPI003C6DB948